MTMVRRHTRSQFTLMGRRAFLAQLIFGMFALLTSEFIDDDDWWVLAPFCLGSIVMFSYVVVRSLRADPESVLCETGIFGSISSVTYYAFGPLLYVFGSVDLIGDALNTYPHRAPQAVWLTGMNFLGLGLAGLAYSYASFDFVSSVSERVSSAWTRASPTRVFSILATIGVLAKYLVVLPFDLALITYAPPGIIRLLANLIVVALMIGWSCGSDRPRWMRPVLVLLLLSELISGLLLFNKSAVLLGVLGSALGDYLARRSLRVLLVVSAIAVSFYVIITPVVTYGRQEIWSGASDGAGIASLSERLGILGRYASSSYRSNPMNHHQDWWRRLDYIPEQQFAIERWQSNDGGADYELLPWILVPRAVYPDKPSMTGAGIDLFQKMTGYRSSSIGIGVFVDGYYNLGWPGFLFTSLSFGLVLRIYTNISRAIVRRRALLMYPIAFMGLFAGLRVDGFWLADVAGPFIYVLVGFLVFRAFARR